MNTQADAVGVLCDIPSHKQILVMCSVISHPTSWPYWCVVWYLITHSDVVFVLCDISSHKLGLWVCCLISHHTSWVIGAMWYLTTQADVIVCCVDISSHSPGVLCDISSHKLTLSVCRVISHHTSWRYWCAVWYLTTQADVVGVLCDISPHKLTLSVCCQCDISEWFESYWKYFEWYLKVRNDMSLLLHT